MKGLNPIPSVTQLLAAYELIQTRPDHVTESELMLWSQWVRFDPRLAEQVVSYLLFSWKSISPLSLNEKLFTQPWPAALGVLLAHAEVFGKIPRDDRIRFKMWAACVMAGIPPATGEQFFIGLRAFAGKSMLRDAEFSIAPYSRWGYLGQDILINKAVAACKTGKTTLISRTVREGVLKELLQNRKRVTVKDYREALSGFVGQRQAELDLKRHSGLKKHGHTRGRYYVQSRKKLA